MYKLFPNRLEIGEPAPADFAKIRFFVLGPVAVIDIRSGVSNYLNVFCRNRLRGRVDRGSVLVETIDRRESLGVIDDFPGRRIRVSFVETSVFRPSINRVDFRKTPLLCVVDSNAKGFVE